MNHEETIHLPATDTDERAFDLTLDVTPSSESHFFADLSGDMSRGGLFVATYRDIAVGTAVSIACNVLGAPLRLTGVVAWHRDPGPDAAPGLGVRLAAMSPEARRAIDRFCATREPLYYEVDLLAA
jgi:uncharacterized protein (TIGR02266 family)